MIAGTLRLIRQLPPVAKLSWLLLVTGLILAASGFLMEIPWQGYSGLSCLITGYLLAILDMIFRKRRRTEAAGFYTGLLVAPILATFIFLFVGLLAGVVLLVTSFLHGWSADHGLQMLHYLGILFAFMVIIAIPAIAVRAEPSGEDDQE